ETGVKPINDPELFINSILPKEMSEYFFFQGEGVGSFTKAKVGHNREVKEAIQNILGFKTAQQAIDDLGDIKKDYRKEVATRNKSSELAKLSEEISKLEQEKIAKDSRLSLCDKNIGMYEQLILDIDEKLANSNSTVVKQNHQNRAKLDKQKSVLTQRIKAKEVAKVRLIKMYGA